MKRLLLTSPKGGTGKTTLSRNAAVAAALSGLSVGTVDLDRQRSLTKWWAKRPADAASISHFDADMNDTASVLTDISGFDLLVIDTPPAVEEHPADIQALLAAADFVLIPSQTTDDDTDSVVAWMAHVAGHRRLAAFVLNRIRRNTASLRTAKIKLNRAGQLCPVEIPHTEDMARAAALGLGILEIKGGSGAEEIGGVWDFVRNGLDI